MTTPSEAAFPAPSFDATVDLVRLAQGGDREALDALFSRYSNAVLGMVRVRLRSKNKLRRSVASGDLMQNALLQAFQKFDEFEIREEARFVNWLSKIVEYKVLDEIKRWSSQKNDPDREVRIDAGSGDDDEGGFDLRGVGGTPSQDLQARENSEKVSECLSALPEHYREILLVRDYSRASWQTVTEELGMSSVGASQMLHSRATQALGRELRKRGLR